MSAAVARLGNDRITDLPATPIVDKYSSVQREAHLVTVLVPCERHDTRPYPGKSYARRPDGSLATVGFDMRGGTFDAHLAPVSGIDDLHRLLHAVAGKGTGLLVGGGLRDPDRRRSILRRVNGRDGRMPDLVRRPLPYLVLDLDKVPNPLRLDPRTQPEEARAWMLSLLPASLRRARCVLRWSSSTCMDGDGPPDALGIHAWHWLDGTLAPEEAKAITVGIDGHMRDALGLPLRGKGKRLADWKVCEAQQPVYVAPPRCGDGVADPFTPEQRIVLAGGPDDVVVLDDLRVELRWRAEADAAVSAECPVPRQARGTGRRVPGSAATSREHRLPREAMALSAMPLLHHDHPLVEEIGRLAAVGRREAVGKRAGDAVLGAGRAAAELVRVALARVGWGREHPEFAAWAEAGGVPEGERDTWLYSIAACLAHALPRGRALDGTLRALVVRVGHATCGRNWTEAGWVGGRHDGAVVAKAVQAARGEPATWKGGPADARYRWNAAALRRTLCIGADEAAALGLLTLADGAEEKRSRRALAALRRPRTAPDLRAAERAEVLRLRAGDLSLRVVSARTGVPVGTVQAWSARAAAACPAAGTGGRSVTPSTDLGKEEKREVVGSVPAVQPVPPAAEPPSVTALQPLLHPPPAAEAALLSVPAASPVPVLPSFLLRRLAAREAEREGAARYVRHVALLVAEMGRRGAEPPRSWPVTPSTERLPALLSAEVEAAGRALRAALAGAHRRQASRRSRRQSEGEREAFWTACEAALLRNPLEAESMADERLASIQRLWNDRAERADRRARESGDEADRRSAANTRMAGRSVLTAEHRRRDALLGLPLAA